MSILSWFRSHKETTALAIALIAVIIAPFNEDFREWVVKFMFGYSYYENQEIKVKYPAEWKLSISGGRITPDEVFFKSPKDNGFQELVTVYSEKLSSPMSSQDYYTKVLQPQIKNQFNLDLLKNPDQTNLGKSKAQMLVFTELTEKNSVAIKHKLIWTVKNNQAYIVTYKGEDSNFLEDEQTVIEPMRQSFEIR